MELVALDEETLTSINSTVPENEREEAIRLAKVAIIAERRALERKNQVQALDVVKPIISSIKPAASVVYLTKAQREAQRAEASAAPSFLPPVTSQNVSVPAPSSTAASSTQSVESAEIEASKERYLGKSYRVEKDARQAEEIILARSIAPPGRGGGRGGHRQMQRGGGSSTSLSNHRGGGQAAARFSNDTPNEGPTIVSLLRQKSIESGFRQRERFKFRWDNTEDTSTDFNSLYTYNDTAAASDSLAHKSLDEIEHQPPAKRPALSGHGSALGGVAFAEIDDDDLDQRDRRKEELEEVAAARRAEETGEFLVTKQDHGPTHWSQKKLADMTERDWRIFREDFDIHMRGNVATTGGSKENARVIVNPLRSWNECPMHPKLREAINEMGYKHPSPIQRAALPMGMAGRDMIGIAETGSGKTAAFLIPLLNHVLMQSPEVRARCAENGPLALVMAPTRELAQQIDEECRKISRFCAIKSLAVVGGTNMAEQGVKMREGCEVIIGTPGRLIDCISTSILVLNQCNYVVLDEADRMIDLGFEPQVSQILESMGLRGGGSGGDMVESTECVVSRTTHMFTATMPSSVERLAKRYMKTPATLRIGDQDSGKNKRILQEIIFVPNEKRKRSKLMELLSSVQRPCIIFINAKKACNVVARDVEHAGYNCVVLHSDKSQDEREGALRDFKSGSVDLLIATDVAGRGLDIDGVETVINYDMPSDISRYTHRIGRTGRAGKGGRATTMLTEDDNQVLPDLKAYLESTSQLVPPELSSRVSALDRLKGDRRMM